jgi:signal-transduction protein with cAMP-binding, CBS, and nucleotidyltransferase domain
MYKAMKYEFYKQDSNVINYGEYGSTFYILLKGSVSVRVPVPLEKEFQFRELIDYLIENKYKRGRNIFLKHTFSSNQYNFINFYLFITYYRNI